jgi:hypothetical protein
MHMDEEQIQRHLHGELGPATTPVRDHLDSCPECRLKVSESEREEAWVLDRFRRLDHARPELTAEAILNAPRAPRAFRWGRMAAGFFLMLAAAGVAYAAPGSPLPGIIDRIIELVSRSPVPERPVKTTPPVTATEAQAGIAVLPGDRLTIVFLGDLARDTAMVSLTDSAEVMVRARGGSTTFTSDQDRLLIQHRGAPVRFEILIPRQAPSVSINVGDRSRWTKLGARVVGEATLDSHGHYVLPLSQQSSSPAP